MVLTVHRTHGYPWLHVAAYKCALLEQLNWEISKHSQYSSNLAPSDYRLFLHLKKFLAGSSLKSNHETNDVVQD